MLSYKVVAVAVQTVKATSYTVIYIKVIFASAVFGRQSLVFVSVRALLSTAGAWLKATEGIVTEKHTQN